MMRRIAIVAVAAATMAAAPIRPWWEATCGAIAPRKVGAFDTTPQLIHRVMPRVLPAAMIVIETVITVDGRVCAARAVKSCVKSDVEAATVAAVRQWRFRPGMSHGQPVPVVFYVSVGRGTCSPLR